MKKLLLIGATCLIGASVAFADPPAPPKPPGPPPFMAEMDPNGDGFISRDEAGAAAEKHFDEMDTNDDGKLTQVDRPARAHRVIVNRHDTKGKEGRSEERRIERVIIKRGDDSNILEEDIDIDTGDKRVIVRRGEGPARVAMAPRAPMMVMMIANHEEADLDGDGALSKTEFKAQQLRFFDAADANRDGKVKFDFPVIDAPMPPEPPAAPAPPKR
jgi:hypothetical protein